MSHFSAELQIAIRFIISYIVRLSQITIPGTDLSIIGIVTGAWCIFFIFKWFLPKLFDVGDN